MNYINQLWDFLKSIKKITSITISDNHCHFNGHLTGIVKVIENNRALLFFENGTWISMKGLITKTSNIYRWKLIDNYLSLEHLRYGEDHPVLLSKFSITKENGIIFGSHHQCVNDTYIPTLNFNHHFLELNWIIRGPNKNDIIVTRYGV